MTLRLDPIIEGNGDGDTLVFVHGWPDSAALWDDAVDAFRATHRCVRVTMPNFDGARTTRKGHTTLEIVEALVTLIREVSKGKPVTLVLHDWGSYWGHAAHHRVPELVSRVATLDVGPHYSPTVFAMLGIVTYQWWLFGAFTIGGAIGDGMTRASAKVLQVPRPASELTSWMNYPYRNIWSDLFSGRGKELTKGYWPTCPLLFVYGKKKPFMFHSAAWVDHVRKNGTSTPGRGSEVVGLECGHWVTKDPEFVGILGRFLDGSTA